METDRTLFLVLLLPLAACSADSSPSGRGQSPIQAGTGPGIAEVGDCAQANLTRAGDGCGAGPQLARRPRTRAQP